MLHRWRALQNPLRMSFSHGHMLVYYLNSYLQLLATPRFYIFITTLRCQGRLRRMHRNKIECGLIVISEEREKFAFSSQGFSLNKGLGKKIARTPIFSFDCNEKTSCAVMVVFFCDLHTCWHLCHLRSGSRGLGITKQCQVLSGK